MELKHNIIRFLRLSLLRIRCLLGSGAAIRTRPTGQLKVLLLGGFGYGNTGDEAQLGANLQLWKKTIPNADITVLSPNPAYTFKHHKIRSEFASRVIFFKADSQPHYGRSDKIFQIHFWLIWVRMILNVHLMRAGIAPFLASAEEAALLLQLQSTDVLHVSGGGFLTGMTRSRLWDTCLIMKLCQYLGTRYFLTGQTIGVFQSRADRLLAKMALPSALTISLRDPGYSEKELIQLGIPPDIMVSSVDDALFCDKASPEAVKHALLDNGLESEKAYICVNYHCWGMDENTQQRTLQRLAILLDQFIEETGLHVLFIPMVSTDEESEQAVIAKMTHPARLLTYNYDYRIVRGVIGNALCLVSFKHHPLIFALGEGVPAMSISQDDYYWRKNDGAMRNFNQQAFCIHGDAFYQEQTVALLRKLYSDNSNIRSKILAKRSMYRINRTDFYKTVLKKIKKHT